MNNLNRIILIFLYIFFSLKICANRQYIFQQVITQNGLSSSVRCITVSNNKGYVWIGTKTGVCRFNGYELKKYQFGNVSHILEDKENNIWALTPKGIYCYNYKIDNFKVICNNDSDNINVTSLLLFNGRLIFSAPKKLYEYNYKSKKLELITSVRTNKDYSLYNLLKWDDNTILGINRWNGQYLIDINTGIVKGVPFRDTEIAASTIDKKGNIWLSSYNKGIRCYNKNGKLLESYTTGNSELQSDIILSFAESDGRMWVGTDGAGIYIINPEKDTMRQLASMPEDPKSLPSNAILYLYPDPNGTMWASSVRGALTNIKEVGMKTFSNAIPGMSYGMSEKLVLSIACDNNNIVWIGTDGGGINSFNPENKKFHHIKSTMREKIASITNISNDELLFSAFSKGLYFFNKKSETKRPLIIVNDSINSFLCKKGKSVNVFKNSNETILLLSEVPYIYNLKKKEFKKIDLSKNEITILGMLVPIERKGNKTYLNDNNSIYVFNSEDNSLKVICRAKGDMTFSSVTMDKNGRFWIGSTLGLSYYDCKNHKHYNVGSKLISNVSAVICDKRGKLWVGNEGQLFAFLIDKKEFIFYGESDGVILNAYNDKSKLLMPDGSIYMGGVNGLLSISKDLPSGINSKPIIDLEEILVGGESVNNLINNGNEIDVEEKGKPVTISVIAHDKDIFSKPMYRFIIQGMNEQVIYSHQPTITLTGLSANEYKIYATCSTQYGGWSKNYLICELNVLPPWYKSLWFISLCIIFIISGVATAFVMLLRNKDNKMKWAMKEHEQQVYEEKVRFLININHELRTPLTLIHAPLKQLLHTFSSEDVNYRMIKSISKQSERMKDILNMVLDVRKMEVGQSKMKFEKTDIKQWIDDIVNDFTPEAKEKGITISYSVDDSIDTICLDKEKTNTIITNLLINALKYSNTGNNITIAVSRKKEENTILFEIIDEGIGLKGVDINHLFTRFYQGNNNRPGTGIGLSFAKILVEQQDGKIGAHDNELRGATFWFELPADRNEGNIVLQPQPYLNELLTTQQEDTNNSDTVEDNKDKLTCEQYKLLVVDDNKDLTDYMSEALYGRFKEIKVAENGEEALKICYDWHPDIVVSDIQMPVMNGYTLCAKIKEDLSISHIPVILLTARNDEESKVTGYKNGADGYITKPFEIETLISMICGIMDNRENIRKRYSDSSIIPQPVDTTFSSADEKFLEELNDFICKNISNTELKVPDICSEMAMSRSSLYNKLKNLTGMGANDYILKIKLREAIKMLETGNYTVNEIADMTGFSTPRYFSTVFKQAMGCSPTQYKKP